MYVGSGDLFNNWHPQRLGGNRRNNNYGMRPIHHCLSGIKSPGAGRWMMMVMFILPEFVFICCHLFSPHSLLLCIIPYSCQALLTDVPSWSSVPLTFPVPLLSWLPFSCSSTCQHKKAHLYPRSLLSLEFTYKGINNRDLCDRHSCFLTGGKALSVQILGWWPWPIRNYPFIGSWVCFC